MKEKGFVLVTGGTGFVGRHLCSAIARDGWRVRATFFRTPPRLAPDALTIEWCQIGSIGPDTDWSQALAGGITTVVHLAAVAHRTNPTQGESHSDYDYVNHLGTANLAAQAIAAQTVRRFLFVSSIGAVASLAEECLDETSLCRPDTPYGRSKLRGEEALKHHLVGSRLEWCILRPTLIYGSGNPGNMERLMRLIDLGLPLPLASIRNRRSFLYIGNLVDAIRQALDHPSAANRVFCIADTETLSTPELILGLGKASGKRVLLFPFPVSGLRIVGRIGSCIGRIFGRSLGFDTASIEKLCGSLSVDSTLFQSVCQWSQPFSLEQGLSATVVPRSKL